MKIAIHNSPGSYSKHWIAYCEENNILYKIVSCYDTDIIHQLEDCDALMWHHNHGNPKDKLFAKQLLYSLESAGKAVYPNSGTTWHFDDKLGQKYLLEALELPLVPTYAFYSKKEAMNWITTAEFPLVFKLRGGAGSRNVKLVKNNKSAVRLIRKAFGKGFRQYDAWAGIRESFRKYRLGKSSITNVLKAIAHIIYPIQLEKSEGREKGYIYLQKFIPDLDRDYRTKVVGNYCWGYQRLVRKNDFRASGSGSDEYIYSKTAIPKSLIKESFEIAKKLKMPTVAFDFVYDKHQNFYLIEISCFFGVDNKEFIGCWDSSLNWLEGSFNPYGWMVEDVISKINEKRK